MAFWRAHKSDLTTAFPPPQHEQVQLQQNTELASKFTLFTSLGSQLHYFDSLPDGSFCAALVDWPSFLKFKEDWQVFSSADFYIHSTQRNDDGKVFVQYSYCR